MTEYDLNEVRRAWERWREAVAVRRSRGEISVSSEEMAALEQLECLVSKLPPFVLARWEEETDHLLTSHDDELCRCGHHGQHHVEGGSCYHPVGCATICDCAHFDPVPVVAELSR